VAVARSAHFFHAHRVHWRRGDAGAVRQVQRLVQRLDVGARIYGANDSSSVAPPTMAIAPVGRRSARASWRGTLRASSVVVPVGAGGPTISPPAAVALPPTTTSPRPSTHAAAARRRGAVSETKVVLPFASIFKTRAVGSPVARVAPTTNCDPSEAVTVAPPAT